MLNTVAVLGYETAPDGSKVDFSQFIANECFKPSYKFNTYKVYGVTADHVASTSGATYDPSKDAEAYPSNIKPESGYMYVDDTSNLKEVRNEYKIVKLDTENKQLIIEPESMHKYFEGSDTPQVTSGVVMKTDGTLDDGSGTNINGDNSPSVDVFTDVSPDSPYYEALTYLKDQGIVKGYDDGSYKPNNTINRAEFTKIVVGTIADTQTLNNCESLYTKIDDYNSRVFNDVVFVMVAGNAPPWYFDYVCVAKHTGLVGGYPDGSFRPATEINFAEAAKIVSEAMNSDTMKAGDPWYKVYVEYLAQNKAIPTTIGFLDQKITRGEMAEIVYRLKAKVTSKPSLTYEDLK